MTTKGKTIARQAYRPEAEAILAARLDESVRVRQIRECDDLLNALHEEPGSARDKRLADAEREAAE